MSEEDKPRCENCRFWLLFGPELGECHAKPPVINAILTKPLEGFAYDQGVWPSTMNDDFCGEFEPHS